MPTTRNEHGRLLALGWQSAQDTILKTHRRMSVKAEAFVRDFGIPYESLLGMRFAVNVERFRPEGG
jgi:hypothetical protein